MRERKKLDRKQVKKIKVIFNDEPVTYETQKAFTIANFIYPIIRNSF